MNTLVVYCSRYQHPLRTAVADHLYSFRRYAPQRCFYLNVAVHGVPRYLSRVQFDLVVFHTIFLSERWDRDSFKRLLRRAQPLKRLGGVKVALPQDEFLNTDLLCDFINDFGIQLVFSAAEESEWPRIYTTVDSRKVKFATVLTGYLDDGTLARIGRLAEAAPIARPIDIGYRAWRAEPWLGRHGFLKTQVADLFRREAPRLGLATDISTRAEDTLLGDRWYEFLLRCKYTIGVEGGASLLDRDGTAMQRTRAYLLHHPQASFDEVEAACFPGQDGSLRLFAVSPRHLEACATRTCQVLVEGTYNGVLVAGRHYIGLKRDFGNLDEVLDLVRNDHLRGTLTEQAYQDVAASGRYTYRRFVQDIIAEALGPAGDLPGGPAPLGLRLGWAWNRLMDRLSWLVVAFEVRGILLPRLLLRKILVRLFSEERVRSAAQRWRLLMRG